MTKVQYWTHRSTELVMFVTPRSKIYMSIRKIKHDLSVLKVQTPENKKKKRQQRPECPYLNGAINTADHILDIRVLFPVSEAQRELVQEGVVDDANVRKVRRRGLGSKAAVLSIRQLHQLLPSVELCRVGLNNGPDTVPGLDHAWIRGGGHGCSTGCCGGGCILHLGCAYSIQIRKSFSVILVTED